VTCERLDSDSRSFVLRNARRTTTLLGLVRLQLNGVDNARRYSELLLAQLNARGGVAPAQRRLRHGQFGAPTPSRPQASVPTPLRYRRRTWGL
jgi:hypothetical protein